jgi:hypothetical protein
MLDSAHSDPDFLNIVITGDESWVYGNEPETKAQSAQRKHSTFPRPKNKKPASAQKRPRDVDRFL